MNSLIRLIIMILVVCFSLVLIILDVMEEEGQRELIESWIGLYVMKSVWMNETLLLIRFLLKFVLTTPLFLLVFLVFFL